jgi:hypothetical protein
MPRGAGSPPGLQFDRIVGTLAAVVVVGLGVFLLIRNEPISDPRLFFVLRLLMSFSAAVLGATIPGFLDVSWSGGGLIVRAGGALALFVLTFLYTPDLVSTQGQANSVNQTSTGGLSPPINNNSGTITIQGNGQGK